MMSENEQIFLEQIYQKYAPSLFRYSLSFLRSFTDAPSLSEECVQETFVVALRKIRFLQKCQSPEGYLMEVCKRITLSRRRKEWNRKRITGDLIPIDEDIQIADVRNRVDEWIDQHDLQQRKQQLIETLTKQELDVFCAYFEDELSMEECATKLAIPTSKPTHSINNSHMFQRQYPLLPNEKHLMFQKRVPRSPEW